jgi:transcriptional regulator of acetoin/glycerol metabolism
VALSKTLSAQVEKPHRGARGGAFLTLAFCADQPLRTGPRFSLGDVDAVAIGRGTPGGPPIEGGTLKVNLDDRRVSSSHAQLVRQLGRWSVEDLGSKNGTWLNGSRLSAPRALDDFDVLEIGHSFLVFRSDVQVPAAVPVVLPESELDSEAGFSTFSPRLGHELERLRAIARSRVPVIVRGETGTGKEVVAAAIHRLSRRPGPFVAVNCGAIPPKLAESELFGYRKGAFSGAEEDRPGLVRSSDRGTLFLDEFAELPPPTQAVLLRVLQESEVVPVGGTKPVKVDLRVVTATHRDLDELIQREQLRADLVARVSGFTFSLPPLRERREDFGLLVSGLLRRHAADAARVQFSVDAARSLILHRWPLNVRQLEKALAAACALAAEERIELRHLPAELTEQADAPQKELPAAPLTPADQQIRDELERHLRAHRGNVSAVAKEMGKFRNQVQRWLRRFNLDPDAFRR